MIKFFPYKDHYYGHRTYTSLERNKANCLLLSIYNDEYVVSVYDRIQRSCHGFGYQTKFGEVKTK